MTPEQPLFYSQNCFGTADAISFSKDKVLRIHDLKTGINPSSMMQLEVYAALFCLEYAKDPRGLQIILRIYQFNEKEEYTPDPEEIQAIMDTIVEFDIHIEKFKEAL